MRFLRLLLVVTLVTLLGGLFGAGVGSLVGYAVPSSFHAGYGAGTQSETVALIPPAPAQDPALKSAAQSPHMNVGFHFRSTQAGAALGAAWGLVMGAIAGLILGIIDQIILAVRSIVSLRQAKSTPVSAGNTP